jgi:tRNA modification GTPase
MRTPSGETIAAIGTAVGSGAISIVRLSGDRAVDIADLVFRSGRSLREHASHTVHHGRIVDDAGNDVDEVLATVMRSPNTYTSEDMVEFGCHGGAMPARRVLEVCLLAGARLARRGEFTERAFLAGRIDLVQAEAIADIVAARTRTGLEAALGQLEGALSGKLADLRSTLVDLRADVEALIDFAEDGAPDVNVDALASRLDAARRPVRELLSRCRLGTAVRDGVAVAIVGKPNVGKSSLMNALLMRDRAIVTAQPGTTRDAIEECVDLAGVPVRLIDTAGWREPSDEAERAGVERAKAAARGAALVMIVVDMSRGIDEHDHAVARVLDPARTVVVANKSDLPSVVGIDELTHGSTAIGGATWADVAVVSAVSGEGLEQLKEALVSLAVGELPGEEPVILTNVRHVAALRNIDSCLSRAHELAAGNAAAEVVAVELNEATLALGTITGETTPEDVLTRIFERFCVGK